MTSSPPNVARETADSFALLTLQEAAEAMHSTVKISTLYRARAEGKLWAKKIGSRYFTTTQAIKEFLQCPDPESPPASTTAKTNSIGSSAMAARNTGQDMALASAKRLKQRCKNTSQTENRPSAEVRPFPGS